MNVTREQAVKLFEAMGFQTAKNWAIERLQSKIKALPAAAKDTEIDIDDDEIIALYEKIIKTLNDGNKVKVVEKLGDEKTSEETPKKDKGGKNKKAKKTDVVVKHKEDKGKKVVKKTAKRISRAAEIAQIINKNKSITIEKLCSEADKNIIKIGGCGNLRETTYQAKIVIAALSSMGYIKFADNKIIRK